MPVEKGRVLAYKEPEAKLFSLHISSTSGGAITTTPLKEEGYEEGEYVELDAVPAEGYLFAGWSGSIESEENPLLLSIEKDEWIIPSFVAVVETVEPEYTIKIAGVTGGTVDLSPNKDSYKADESIMLTATPANGYNFSGWTGTISNTQNPYIHTVDDNEWIIPVFVAIEAAEPEPTYTIKVDTVSGGTVTVDPVKESYLLNETVKLTATASSGYVFTGWSGTINNTQNPYIHTVDGSEWIIPVFTEIEVVVPEPEQRYTIKVDDVIGGNVSIDPIKTDYSLNETVKLTATPSSGYIFTNWTGTLSNTQNPYIHTVDDNEWIIPVFTAIEAVEPEPTYTVRVDTVTGGAVTVDPVKESYLLNETVKLTATASSGYIFTGWTGTINNTQNPYIHTVDSSEWIIPVFTEVVVAAPMPEPSYAILVDSAAGGSVTINPQKDSYSLDDIVRLSASASPGYSFSGWTGTLSSVQNPYIFSVDGNEWIVPQFSAVETYTLITGNPIGGTIQSSAGNRTEFNAGEKITLKAIPSPGYQFTAWEGDIESASDTIYLTFYEDYQVSPRFTLIPPVVEPVTYTLSITAPSNGTITLDPQKSEYYENEIVRVTAKPARSYMFEKWSGAISATEESNVYDLTMNGNKTVGASFMQREWTFLIYMAADNNLDTYAVNDLSELEDAGFDGKPASALVLFDRAQGSAWSGTRLYEVKDEGSSRVALPALEIEASGDIELNMSDNIVLEKFINFGKEQYPATNYGLILWGHGTGWRSGGTMAASRGVAIDDSSVTYMSLSSLGDALSGKNLSFIGIDTCFGALLETAYELRADAQYLAASPGLIPSAGWNYEALFTDFLAKVKANRTSLELGKSVVSAFKSQYTSENGASISLINLSNVNTLFSAFDTFAENAANYLSNETRRNTVSSAVLFGSVKNYYQSPSAGGTEDYYIDIKSFANYLSGVFSTSLITALTNAIPASWSKAEGDNSRNIGVYLTEIQRSGSNMVASELPDTYSYGNSASGIIDFVKNSANWPPSYGSTPRATSFLDKLFRWTY
jgi:hypothetical protein